MRNIIEQSFLKYKGVIPLFHTPIKTANSAPYFYKKYREKPQMVFLGIGSIFCFRFLQRRFLLRP